jgi:hypothetical protein
MKTRRSDFSVGAVSTAILFGGSTKDHIAPIDSP